MKASKGSFPLSRELLYDNHMYCNSSSSKGCRSCYSRFHQKIEGIR